MQDGTIDKRTDSNDDNGDDRNDDDDLYRFIIRFDIYNPLILTKIVKRMISLYYKITNS